VWMQVRKKAEDIVCSKIERFCHWYHLNRFILLNLFHGILSPMLFSFQHTTGSWTADPQGSFPSFVAFCSPTLHDKDLIFPIFMDTPEYQGVILLVNQPYLVLVP